jgi:hypothetical protein
MIHMLKSLLPATASLFYLLMATPLIAQGPASTPILPPMAPLVAEVPPNSTFSVAITYADEPQPALPQEQTRPQPKSDRPRLVQVWRDSKSRRILVEHANGAKSEGFLFDSGFVVRSTGNSNKTFVAAGATGRDASLDIFTLAFPGTQWIDLKFYKGSKKDGYGDVYYYEQEPGNSSPAGADGGSGGVPSGYKQLDYMRLEAFIRLPDKMPAVVTLGPATYTFTTPQPWDGTISMPDNFKASAESFTKELNILEALKKKKK